MDPEIQEQDALGRRSLLVTGFGDTADELELSALDQARTFFGTDRQLEIVAGYKVWPTHPGGDAGTGKAYRASLWVREP